MGLLYDDFTKERKCWKELEEDLKKALAASNENLDGKQDYLFMITNVRYKNIAMGFVNISLKYYDALNHKNSKLL